jgi:hypothetical protein
VATIRAETSWANSIRLCTAKVSVIAIALEATASPSTDAAAQGRNRGGIWVSACTRALTSDSATASRKPLAWPGRDAARLARARARATTSPSPTSRAAS